MSNAYLTVAVEIKHWVRNILRQVLIRSASSSCIVVVVPSHESGTEVTYSMVIILGEKHHSVCISIYSSLSLQLQKWYCMMERWSPWKTQSGTRNCEDGGLGETMWRKIWVWGKEGKTHELLKMGRQLLIWRFGRTVGGIWIVQGTR